MAKLKHSKVKNTGILFELLARQLTADTLNGVENSPAIKIIREFFVKKSALKRELQLYQSLVKERLESETAASQFIDVVLTERSKLTNKVLANQKYNLIKEIKKYYPIEKFFAAPVAKYKNYASAYKLFETVNNESFNEPTVILQSRTTLIEGIVPKKSNKPKSSNLTENFKNQDEDTRLLAYKILVDKFNSKYKGLSKAQKNLLEQYINNVSNKKTLAEFINKESSGLYNNLTKQQKQVKDKIVSIKLAEVIKHLKPLTIIKSVKDKHVLNMMRYYDLKTELTNVAKRSTRQVV